MNEAVAKSGLLMKVAICPPIYAIVHAVMLSKKDQRSTIEAALCEEALTIAGGHNLLLLHHQAHDRKSIAESLYAYLNRYRLTACEMCGVHIL